MIEGFEHARRSCSGCLDIDPGTHAAMASGKREAFFGFCRNQRVELKARGRRDICHDPGYDKPIGLAFIYR